MKKHSNFFEILIFFIVFLFFILPPFFVTNSSEAALFSTWQFPFQQMIMAAFALTLYLIFYEKQKKSLPFFPVMMTLALLFTSALFIKFFSLILISKNPSQVNKTNQANMQVILPEDFISWLFCILNFFFAALYEEILYRFYFVDKLYDLLSNLLSEKIGWKFLPLICEIAGCGAFAFAHFYLGIFSVINAIFGHVILRLCYKKSGNIWAGVTAHFIYNVISLILL